MGAHRADAWRHALAGRDRGGLDEGSVAMVMGGGEAPVRLFTRAEANALLPELRRLLGQVSAARRRLLQTARELEALERKRDRSNALQLGRNLRETRERLGAAREALRAALDEIVDQGVQVKNVEPALLDFPAWHEGRIVLLCWRDGEPSVSYWHDLDAGFAGRRPL